MVNIYGLTTLANFQKWDILTMGLFFAVGGRQQCIWHNRIHIGMYIYIYTHTYSYNIDSMQSLMCISVFVRAIYSGTPELTCEPVAETIKWLQKRWSSPQKLWKYSTGATG